MDIVRRSSQLGSRVLFVTLVATASTGGFIPIMLFLKRPFWLVWIFVGAALIATGSLIQVRLRAARPLTILERFSVGVSGLFLSAIAALFPFIGYGVGRMIDVLLSSTEEPTRWAAVVAFVTSLVFLVVGVGLVCENVASALFPKTGVGNAPLFPKVTWRVFLGYGTTTVVIVILAVFGVQRGWYWAALVLELVLIFVSAPLNSEFEPKAPPARASAVEAVRSLILLCGYKIIERLQTEDISIDKLISTFDLVAHREGNVLAIQFKTRGAGTGQGPVTWTEATAVPTALWAVRRAAQKLDLPIRNATAILVLAGRTLTKRCGISPRMRRSDL